MDTDRSVDGASFVFGTPETPVAIWGKDDQVLWASGESLMIVGPSGVGKTTLAQQIVLARLGIRGTVLGFPVLPEPQRVLYVAADRPGQAARSLARMVAEEDRSTLNEGLIAWRGPLPFDLGQNPERLVSFIQAHGATSVVIDSAKDAAFKLSDDEVGARFNHAIQCALAAGIEVVVLHHQRKRQQGGGKPTKLEDVYGSVWITAGAGSVVLLWGESGDALVDLSHLKQPAENVGPLKLLHDHTLWTHGDRRGLRSSDLRSHPSNRRHCSTGGGRDVGQERARSQRRRTSPTEARWLGPQRTAASAGGHQGWPSRRPGDPLLRCQPSGGPAMRTRESDHGTDHGTLAVRTDYGAITAITAEHESAGRGRSRYRSRRSRYLAITLATLFRGGGARWRGVREVRPGSQGEDSGRALSHVWVPGFRKTRSAGPNRRHSRRRCGSRPVAQTAWPTSFALVSKPPAVHVHTTARHMGLSRSA